MEIYYLYVAVKIKHYWESYVATGEMALSWNSSQANWKGIDDYPIGLLPRESQQMAFDPYRVIYFIFSPCYVSLIQSSLII